GTEPGRQIKRERGDGDCHVSTEVKWRIAIFHRHSNERSQIGCDNSQRRVKRSRYSVLPKCPTSKKSGIRLPRHCLRPDGTCKASRVRHYLDRSLRELSLSPIPATLFSRRQEHSSQRSGTENAK